MPIDLQGIKDRLTYANQAIEENREYDIPVKMMYCDILDLLGLLEHQREHPGSKPPEHERTVLTLVEHDDGKREWRLNAWCESETFIDGWLFRLNKVICWRELPPVQEESGDNDQN